MLKLLAGLGGAWKWIVGALGAVLAILAAVLRLQSTAKTAGRGEAENESLKANAEAQKNAQEIETRNRAAGADERRSRLFRDYSRKD